MSLVLAPADQVAGRDPPSWHDRVVRLVPIDTIAPYLLAVRWLPTPRGVGLAIFVAGVVATIAALALHARHHRLHATVAQHAVRVQSFIAMAFVVADPLGPAAPIDPRIPATLAVAVPIFGAVWFAPAPRAPRRRA